jgi:hypothetical protein
MLPALQRSHIPGHGRQASGANRAGIAKRVKRRCETPDENRAAFCKRDMNPQKTNLGTRGLSLVHACRRFSEAAMHKLLTVALFAACAVNVACLWSYL